MRPTKPTKREVITQEARGLWQNVAVALAGCEVSTSPDQAIRWADVISDAYVDRYLGSRASGKDIGGRKL